MTDSADVADAATGVGDELARGRAALGLSIADIAQQLKFAARQIEAMEQGRFEALPSGTFARGMVRSYARLLKLDAEPLVGRMAARVAVPDNAGAVASTRRPIPITDNDRRTNLIYAASSVAILALIAVVVFEWQSERSNAARLSFVPAAQAPHLTAQAPHLTAQAPHLTAQAPHLTAQALVEPQRTAAASAVAMEPSNLIFQPSAEATAPSAVAEGNRRIVMKFDRASWVEVRGRDGKTLLSRLNAAGSEQIVEGQPPFSLVIGNAQHVRMSYEDRQIDLAPHVKVEVARFTLD
jgi:cytoskeleton protein RodZ